MDRTEAIEALIHLAYREATMASEHAAAVHAQVGLWADAVKQAYADPTVGALPIAAILSIVQLLAGIFLKDSPQIVDLIVQVITILSGLFA